MRILVLGGDGFCGWPTSLHLSAAGHDVAVVDNFSRRGADAELGVDSLTPIGSLNDRVAAWASRGGAPIAVHALDVATDHDELRDLLASLRPAAVVHLARQRAAPYSMRTATHRRYTVDNNVSATHGLLTGLVETGVDAHVVAVGGRGGTRSVADLTATLSRELLAFYARTDGLRVTDLRQGVVWGTQTRETAADERLANRFDYDADHGTVVNRLCVQAAAGLPLEPAGTGDCDLLHLADVVAGVERALADPPAHGDPVRVVEQVTETLRVGDLVARVAALTGAAVGGPHARGHSVVDDAAPQDASTGDGAHGRSEVRDDGARDAAAIRLGAEPLSEVVALARRYRDRIDTRRVAGATRAPDLLASAAWRAPATPATASSGSVTSA